MKNKKKWLTLALALSLAFGGAALAACDDTEQTPTPDAPPAEEDYGAASLSVNTETVRLGVGDTYTLTATATGAASYEFNFSVDGYSDESVVMITKKSDDSVVLTGLKAGHATIVVSTQIDGEYYWKTVAVCIAEANNITVEIPNFTQEENGFSIALSTVENPSNEADISSLKPDLKIASRGVLIDGAYVEWESDDTDVVKIVNGAFTAVGKGETTVIGTVKNAGAPMSVAVKVSVYLPKIVLNETVTVEVEDLKEQFIEADLEGVVQSVSLDGISVGAFSKSTGSLTFEKEKLPTDAKDMGEGKEIVIATDKAQYLIKANVYTKVISTKEDLDQMGALAKACEDYFRLWNGYFVLDSDIAYNGIFNSIAHSMDIWTSADPVEWSNGQLYGFKGVFDGKGHTIDGLEINQAGQCGGLFGVLHRDGMIKNVAFTNAFVAANSGYICSAGGGKIENVYVQYKSVGKGSPDRVNGRYHGTFFSYGAQMGAEVSNCFIDASKAEFFNKDMLRLGGVNSWVEYKNTFIVCGDEDARNGSGVSAVYADIHAFVADKSAQLAVSKLDGDFWTLRGGVLLPVSVYDSVYKNAEIGFADSVGDHVMANSSYTIAQKRDFVKYTVSDGNVTVEGNRLIIGALANGAKITVTMTSLWDDTDSVSKEFTVLVITENQDLTATGARAYIDLSTGKVDFGSDFTTKPDLSGVLYYTYQSGDVTTLDALALGNGTLVAVTPTKTIAFNYCAVTKILNTFADLSALKYTGANSTSGNWYTIDGYYALGGNIDGNGATVSGSTPAWNAGIGFVGTLDGRGYTVSNFSATENGLFGHVSGATIKNIKFEMNSAGDKALAYAFRSCTIENVTLKLNSLTYPGYGSVLSSELRSCTITNLTVDVSSITFTGGYALSKDVSSNTFTNTVVIVKDSSYNITATGTPSGITVRTA